MGIRRLLLLAMLIPSMALQAQQDTARVVLDPDSIAPGVQGSVNPLTDNTKVMTGDELLDSNFPNSWPVFGSDVRMSVGGYVKADFIRDFDYIGDRYEMATGSIAVEGSPERELGGITTFHAKQSRVNFDLRSKAAWKSGKEYPLQVFVEFDWFFDSDAMRYNTRLRLAYGVIGRVLVGRSWTNSGDLSAIPSTIDFSAGDALYGGRAAQIRLQTKINDQWSYVVALEDAGGQIDNPLGLGGGFRPLWPNLAGNVKWRAKSGSSVQLGFDAFPMSWVGPDSVPNVQTAGAAVTVTGRVLFDVTEYTDALVYGGGFGEGMAHRVIALSWDGKASGVISDNNLKLAPTWWGFAGYNHYWNKSLNSTVSVNYTTTELADIQSDQTILSAGSFHANLIWFPTKLVSTGVEYMWGLRENKDGAQGTATRIQFMVKFKFH